MWKSICMLALFRIKALLLIGHFSPFVLWHARLCVERDSCPLVAMSDVNEQLSIDEINLVRLVRRLEKYVASEEEWRVNKELPLALRVKKTVQVCIDTIE